MIDVRGLVKTYQVGHFWWKKHVPVLKGFNFQAFPGEVTGLLGPNGAGKTTFFRTLCGLERITAGHMEVDGILPSEHPELMRGRIALLPEEASVAPEMSGHKHLFLFGVMMGLERRDIERLMQQADEALQLNTFWTRPFQTYSRGQKARVALARMRMMPHASVLIFDEPSNGLDFESVTRLHVFIRQLAQEGKTVLVASHILSDLRTLCDRMVGLHDGKEASQETLNQWLHNHALVHERQKAEITEHKNGNDAEGESESESGEMTPPSTPNLSAALETTSETPST